MRSKSLVDDPETFFSQLSLVLNSGDARGDADPDGWKKNRAALLARVPKKDRAVFQTMIGLSRTGARVREYTKSRMVKVTYKFKKAYGELARRMVAEGLLPDEDAVYFLTHEELGDLALSGAAGYAKKAMARRRLYPEQQSLVFGELYFGRPEPIRELRADKNASALSGTPVSRGIFEGAARVVKTAADANELKPGEIMVAGFTDAGWTPYYCMIGALVTEVGAALSHGAVVAREFSLPLVANVTDATRVINTGDMLRVNGAAGTVEILRRAS
jgi:pyruvate,water dikinase